MWNAKLYDTFSNERRQPSVDLVNRLIDGGFNRILDAGCGSGMSTSALVSAFGEAEIIGVDLSENMLNAAKEALPCVEFIQRDCSEDISDLGKFDLIFSNAFMQWLDDQNEFIRRAFDMLNEKGVFAAQVPLSHLMPSRKCMDEAISTLPESLRKTERKSTYLSAEFYYNALSRHTDKLNVWVTDYYHIMNGHEDILNFFRGTALNPYTEKLDEKECGIFLDRVLNNLKKAYPIQDNGKVLFPFKRLFMVAVKAK